MPSHPDELSEEQVAQLLEKDAKRLLNDRSVLGVHATNRPSSTIRKPNIRFLNNIIRETDNHNSALKLRELESAGDRLRKLRGDPPRAKEHRRERPVRRSPPRSRDEARDREDARSRRRRSSSASRERRRSGSRDRGERRRRRRRSRSRSESPGPRASRRSGRSDRTRRRERRDEDERERWRVDDSPRRRRRDERSASDDSDRRLRRREARHGREGGRRARSRSRDGSRRRDRNDGNVNAARSRTSRQLDESPPGDSASPRPAAPETVIRRGRGAHTPAGSAMDARFLHNYDPRAEVSTEADEMDRDDWDESLETMRDRAKWQQIQAERLRAAGFTPRDLERWEKGESEVDVVWRSKGQGREWDRGKVVEADGTINTKADWVEP